MKRRDYNAFIGDIQRYRPLAVVVISIFVLLPTFDEMLTQSLSMLVVLFRLAEVMFVDSIMVWLVSSVLLHYARTQSRAERVKDSQAEFHA
ncbi:MAG: hypothetical protein M0Z96_02070 [Actinomycetota bacterium]|nr:hypothetical protein [Actinomycetota bacterium]